MRDLVKIVKLTKKVIDRKSPLPILSCIKVDVLPNTKCESSTVEKIMVNYLNCQGWL